MRVPVEVAEPIESLAAVLGVAEPEPDWRAVPDCLQRWDAAKAAVLVLRDILRNLLLVAGGVHAELFEVASVTTLQGITMSRYYANLFVGVTREKPPTTVPDLEHWRRILDFRISLALRELKSYVNTATADRHPMAWRYEKQWGAFVQEEPHLRAKAAMDALLDGYRRALAARIQCN